MIITENGVDNVVANPNNRIQKFSAYKQWDITQKLLFRPSEKINHLLNIQFSNTSDIPRYDRLQDKRYFNAGVGTTLRYAEWYYGPQKRSMGSYEFSMKKLAFLDDYKINLNYQDIEESRQQREYRRYDRFDSRVEKVKVAAFNIDGKIFRGRHELTAGIDGQLNDVKSRASRTNLATGVVSKLDTRYPDGKNKMNYFGIYAQHLMKSKNGKFILNDGIRLQAITLHSTIADNSFFNFPLTDFKQDPFAVTGNIGFVWFAEEAIRITGNISSGFRAPNIDDLARIFESSAATQRLIVPNPDINPEYTYNFDFGGSWVIPEKVRIELSSFYTLFRNAIAPAPFTLNGEDSIDYNGVRSAIFANQNINNAYLYGFNFRLHIDITKTIKWDYTTTYTYGKYKNDDGAQIPMDHIPPVFGKTAFSYTGKKLNTELYLMYNDWKRIEDYNPNGEDNGQYATGDGMPAWFTLNWKGSYSFNKNLQLQLGVENILDRNYRYFASGFSAPGRNFIVALRVNW